MDEYFNINLQRDLKNSLNNFIEYDISYVIDNISFLLCPYIPSDWKKFDSSWSNVIEFLRKKQFIKREKINELNYSLSNTKDFYSKVRKVYPDFCLNMDKKTKKEDYDFYLKGVKDLSHKVKTSSIIKWKISARNAHDYIEMFKEKELDFEDEISAYQDTFEFNKLIQIQKKFQIFELYESFKIISKQKKDEKLSEEEKKELMDLICEVKKQILEKIEESKLLKTIISKSNKVI